MGVKQRLTTLSLIVRKKRTIVIIVLFSCLLLCGFIGDWHVLFTDPVHFPVADAASMDMIQSFSGHVQADVFESYLNDNTIAEQIITGVQANLSGNVYDIELPEMHEEPLGKKIVRIIMDRLFS